jgi:mannose-6-phosphate isomerase-like protein (cupin superfamily)
MRAGRAREVAMARIAGGGVVQLPGEARLIDVGPFDVVVHADADVTNGAFSLIETVEPDAGLGPPLHVHRDCAESFLVLAGRYRMHLAGDDFECPPGSFVYVPRGMIHTFQTLEPGSRKLNLYTPAGMVGYFDELATGIRAGLEDAGLDAIAERFEMDVLGPVPEGYL